MKFTTILNERNKTQKNTYDLNLFISSSNRDKSNHSGVLDTYIYYKHYCKQVIRLHITGENMMSKCNRRSWMGSWNRRRTLEGKLARSK